MRLIISHTIMALENIAQFYSNFTILVSLTSVEGRSLVLVSPETGELNGTGELILPVSTI